MLFGLALSANCCYQASHLLIASLVDRVSGALHELDSAWFRFVPFAAFITNQATTRDANRRAGLMVNELQKIFSKPQGFTVSFNHDRDSVILSSGANHFRSRDRGRWLAVDNPGLARDPFAFRGFLRPNPDLVSEADAGGVHVVSPDSS